MKKLISLLTILAIVLACAAASASASTAKVVDPEANRNIKITPAGDNPWPTDGTSPTTGRTMAELEELYQDGMGGMVVTGKYSPIMVQHCSYDGATGYGTPFYGSYADIYYESAKYMDGTTRLTMVFNDFLPKYAGASRSIRVGHVWVQQEWNCPFFFQGMQETNAQGSNLITNVKQEVANLKIPGGSEDFSVGNDVRTIFNGTNGAKEFLSYKFIVDINPIPKVAGVVWDLPGLAANLLGDRSYEDHNHTLKFGDLPEGGDTANDVYVLFRDNARPAKGTDEDDGMCFYNCLYQYEPEENVYYRYAIGDLENPDQYHILFEEQLISNETVKRRIGEAGSITKGTLSHGNAITFANVIVQAVEMQWAGGSMERPYPTLLGTGNADYFIGGKHYSGVWKRDTYSDRTVFYGEDGQEITLQPGRTIIVQMDYNTSNHRSVRYE